MAKLKTLLKNRSVQVALVVAGIGIAGVVIKLGGARFVTEEARRARTILDTGFDIAKSQEAQWSKV